MKPPRRPRPARPGSPAGSPRRPRSAGPARPAAGPAGDARRHAGASERRLHGLRACEALFAHRPEAIVRVYVSPSRKPTFKRLLEYCVQRRLGFQVVDDASLEKLSGGIHHEGIVILARERPTSGAEELVSGVVDGTIRGPLVYLDGVQNPHNLGSILRTAAHFGCGAVVGGAGDLPALSAAAARVAEGGAEFVPLFACEDPPAVLGALRRGGLRVVTSSSRRGDPIAAARLTRDVVLLLGSEAEGVSPRLAALADVRARIPGSGAVQSLGVAVACGILLAECCRGDGR